jgi:hypothetical protein
MRGLKTAVQIWKKEIEFKFTTWGIKEEQRKNMRSMRQDSIRHLRQALISDLMNRHHIGDIIIFPEDLVKLSNLRRTPILSQIEVIHKKYT